MFGSGRFEGAVAVSPHFGPLLGNTGPAPALVRAAPGAGTEEARGAAVIIPSIGARPAGSREGSS